VNVADHDHTRVCPENPSLSLSMSATLPPHILGDVVVKALHFCTSRTVFLDPSNDCLSEPHHTLWSAMRPADEALFGNEASGSELLHSSRLSSVRSKDTSIPKHFYPIPPQSRIAFLIPDRRSPSSNILFGYGSI
jgi:hypothetical protein